MGLCLTSAILFGCATPNPTQLQANENIVGFTKRLAREFSPGVMKAVTYLGMNGTSFYNDDVRVAKVKVKGGLKESQNIEQSFQNYCAGKQGESLVTQQYKERTSRKVLISCFDDIESEIAVPKFSVFIHYEKFPMTRDLECFSILAVESVKPLKAKTFADHVLQLDKVSLQTGFYSTKNC